MHRGVQLLVRDLNHLYREVPALHELDCEAEGFAWIDCNDAEASVISYLRHATNPQEFVVILCNFTPVARAGYRIGVPHAGEYREILNTDSAFYGGGDVGNAGGIRSEVVAAHGYAQSLLLTLPPLATLVLAPI